MSKKNIGIMLTGGLIFLAAVFGLATNYVKNSGVCVTGIGVVGLALVLVGIRNEKYLQSRSDVHALIIKLADKEAPKRCDAAQALGLLKDTRATESLITALKDENQLVQQASAKALSHMGELSNDQTQILKEWFDSYVDSLIKELDNPFYPVSNPQQISSRSTPKPSPEDPVAHKNRDALVAIGLPAVKYLIAALHHPNLNVRLLAISALGRIGDPSAIEPLKNTIENSSSTERAWAVSALGKIGRSDITEQIIKFLHDPDIYVREAAVLTLENFGDSRALPELEHVANSDKALVDRYDSISDLAKSAIKKIRKRTKE